jgi:hypothetical protein
VPFPLLPGTPPNAGRRGTSGREESGTGEGWKGGRGPSRIFGSSSISLQGRQIICWPRWAPGQSHRHGARVGEAEGRQRGGDVAGGHPRFLGEAQCRRSAPGASRHRSPPRDLVDSRTARWVEVPVPSGGRTDAPAGLNGEAGSWKRRAAGGGVGRVQRVRRERCLRKVPRYSPLRELATARRQALPRRTLSVVCNQICDEPNFWEGCGGPGSSPQRTGASRPDDLIRDLENDRLPPRPGFLRRMTQWRFRAGPIPQGGRA